MIRKMDDDDETQGWWGYSEADIFTQLVNKDWLNFLEDNLAICIKTFKGGHILWASGNRTTLSNNGRSQNRKDC